MQFEDPRSILEAAAATPARGLDAQRLLKRGRRMRRARYAGVAAGLVITLVGASASMGMLDGREGPRPAGDGAACDVGPSTVSIFLLPGATDADVERLRTEVASYDGVVSVEYVSEQETFQTLSELTDLGGIGPDSAPRQLRAVVEDEDTSERLQGMKGEAILGAFEGFSDYKCLARQICDLPAPLSASVFLNDDAPERKVGELQADLESRPGVVEVRYVSKERAHAEFRRLESDPSHLYDSMGPDDFPASLRVTVTEEAALDQVRYVLSPVVDEVRIGGDFRARICDEEIPSPIESQVGEEESSLEPESLDLVPDVQPDLLAAECGTGLVEIADGEPLDLPGDAWCRFEVSVFNAGNSSVPFDYESQALRTKDGLLAPWMPNLRRPASSGALFAEPVQGETLAQGRLLFAVPVDVVPLELELSTSAPVGTSTFTLDHDCPYALDEDPDGACYLSGRLSGGDVEVSLYHCGVDPLVFGGEFWDVDRPPFDATNAPEDFAGRGRFEITGPGEAVYTDRSGERIEFAIEESPARPPCA